VNVEALRELLEEVAAGAVEPDDQAGRLPPPPDGEPA
jgi:hypothetical protein